MSDWQSSDQIWMEQALLMARKAQVLGEVPVGAVLVKQGQLLSQGWNHPIQSHDPSAHCEIHALRQAGRLLGNYRLVGCTLYVTLEPCVMCAGALLYARIERLVFATPDAKTGAFGGLFDLQQDHPTNHQIKVCQGLLAEQSRGLLKQFFAERRLAKASTLKTHAKPCCLPEKQLI